MTNLSTNHSSVRYLRTKHYKGFPSLVFKKSFLKLHFDSIDPKAIALAAAFLFLYNMGHSIVDFT